MVTSKQVGQVLEMSHFISTNTNDDVFVRYSPHVDWVDVEIHKGGWSESKSREPLAPNQDVNGLIDLADENLFNSVFATLETMCDEIMQGE